MSYCRFLQADAYIFESNRGLECCGCIRAPRRKFDPPYVDMFGIEHEYDYDYVYFDTAQEMLEHIAYHRSEGDNIPERVDERIREDFPDLTASITEANT